MDLWDRGEYAKAFAVPIENTREYDEFIKYSKTKEGEKMIKGYTALRTMFGRSTSRRLVSVSRDGNPQFVTPEYNVVFVSTTKSGPIEEHLSLKLNISKIKGKSLYSFHFNFKYK